MGIQDRDYQRDNDFDRPPGMHLGGPKTLTTKLVLFTAAVYVLQLLIPGFTEAFQLKANWFTEPWQIYSLLSYGFLHAVEGIGKDLGVIMHLGINMLILWMFGQDIERRYGQREFLWFYLSAIVFAGLIWSLIEFVLEGPATPAAVVGASGGIAGVFALYALNFPHRKVLFMFFIPMPVWVAALIGIVIDVNGAIDRSGPIACSAHLAGALFGLYYFKTQWSPGRWLADKLGRFSLLSKSKLRIHAPPKDEENDVRVDEILRKIQQHGQDSLTRKERRILEKASREYQRKRE